jgi:starch synthase
MGKARVLYIAQEITPYLKETQMSKICRYLPQGIQERKKEIRTFMPRFGNINERRNQLHEVIRLSGMNLIIDDADHPLIIKVASIQSARMQIYFIDNEDYFQRKFTIRNKSGKFYEDNDERMIFFARGVIETVKKLGWAPDIVHCHGWLSALAPLYINKIYRDDPIFAETKIITSLYNDTFEENLNDKLIDKMVFDGIPKKQLAHYKTPNYVNIMKSAIDNSDAIIQGSENINEELNKYVDGIKKPLLGFQSNEEEYIDIYNEFYDNMLKA